MLKMISKPAVKLVERYLPDPYISVLLLTLLRPPPQSPLSGKRRLRYCRYLGRRLLGLANLLYANAAGPGHRFYAGKLTASETHSAKNCRYCKKSPAVQSS